MNSTKFVAAALAAVSTLALSSSALAQAAAAAAPALSQGPAINGMCILSVEGVIGGSTVGKYVSTRMQQIGAQVQAELTSEKTSLDNDAKSLDSRRASLDQNSFEQQAAALQVRLNALQRKAQQRDREMQATEQKALARVGDEMEPMIKQAYQQKNCSVLLQRSAVVLASPAMDITPQVTTALNAKITQFAFDRERLDQPAPTAAAAPRPAAAPAKK